MIGLSPLHVISVNDCKHTNERTNKRTKKLILLTSFTKEFFNEIYADLWLTWYHEIIIEIQMKLMLTHFFITLNDRLLHVECSRRRMQDLFFVSLNICKNQKRT